MATHRFWRIRSTGTALSITVTIPEIQFRGTAGGANLATNSANITASSVTGTATPDKAIDGLTTTSWQASGGLGTGWIAYDFGTPTSILEAALTAPGLSTNGMPNAGMVEASDDGSNWITEATFSHSWVTNGETFLITVPASDPAPPAVTTLATSKLNSYAVVGSFPNRTTATKLSGYAVIGPRPDGVSVNKLTGYAIIGPRSDGISVNKMSGYAVVYDPTTGQPNPLAPSAASRWLSCTNRGLGLS